MVRVIFVEAGGDKKEVSALETLSVMEAALMNGIDGIQSICGGICSCFRCHCLIKEPWASRVPRPEGSEAVALEELPGGTPESRLGCQIILTTELDGLTVHLLAAEDP